MATTPRQILTGSYAKSKKNQPGTIATESTELLQVVIRALRAAYSYAARVNPIYFAESSDVVWDTDGWPLPTSAESIFRLENNADQTEIVIVPFDDRTAESGMPAVYRMGAKLYPAGNAGDPDNTVTITFWYSKRPDDPADLDTAIDATWPEQFNELLILAVAAYLAQKDERGPELAALKGELGEQAKLFGAHLEHHIAQERRRTGQLRRFNSPTLFPTASILGGGADATPQG